LPGLVCRSKGLTARPPAHVFSGYIQNSMAWMQGSYRSNTL
jgi:hypothetical protein